ncbi:acetate--CoA ligase family protein [bacterium AH-315-B06]|nr:acetate--CoA ligase family protein [bacterium AH-315-B06]
MHLSSLLKPSSVAVLGASANPSVGRDMIETLQAFGYPGPIYPVNPKYESILDIPCYASLGDLPAPPDVVAFCVAASRIPENFRLLPEIGAKAAVIFGGGFAETGEAGRRIQAEFVDICTQNGIALCGPNCMGVINPGAKSATYLQVATDPSAIAGNVGLISQSGQVCISLLSNVRRFGFSLVASTGNEAVVNTADIMDYMIAHDETKVIATFTETIADPERYVAALDRAADRGKPVVVLKVGKNARTRAVITTHTGGLAGDARVFSEVLRAHRAIEVSDFDEFVEVLAACQGRRWPQGRAMSVVTSSGGTAELMLDLAGAADIQLPPLPPEELAEVKRVVGDVAGDGNPLDAWGNGNFRVNTPHALAVVGATSTTDAVVLSYDNDDDAPLGRIENYLERVTLLHEAQGNSVKPHYQLTMRQGLRIAEQIDRSRELGIPSLFGIRQGLGAIDRLARWVSWQGRTRKPEHAMGRAELAEFKFAGRKTVNEYDAKRLMDRLGLRITNERQVASPREAAQAAMEIGYPVVLKAVSDDIPHKSEFGLVLVGLQDADAVARAWETLEGRIASLASAGPAPGILVQEMVSEGIEVFAGVAHKPGFGHALAFGLGGVGIEVHHDFALRMLPLREGDAEQMIGEIRGAALLGSVRGRPANDTASLAKCLYALSDLMAGAGPLIAEIDLNPIKVLPIGQGCIIVDALIVPTPQEGNGT